MKTFVIESVASRMFVRDATEKTFDYILNPYMATRFKTKKEAKEYIAHNMKDNHYKIVEYADAIHEFDRWVETGLSYGPRDKIDNNLSRPYNGESADEVLYWWIASYSKADYVIRFNDYTTWPKLREVFTHLWDIENYYDDNGNLLTTFSISVSRDATDVSIFENELNKILPHITYKNMKGEKIISIFEHSCSGGYDIAVKKNGKFTIHTRYSVAFDNLTIEQLFDRMKTSYWYD